MTRTTTTRRLPRESTSPRVLWLIKGLGPGGAERLLVNQAKVRDRSAAEIEVAWLVPWKDHLVEELAEQDVPARCLRARSELDLRWAWRLRRILRRQEIDVVHVHSPYVAAITRLLVRTLPHRPAVLSTEHNRWPRHARATRWANRATLRLDDASVAVSDDVRDSMPASLRSRVEVLVHGVALDEVRAAGDRRSAARAELGVRDGEVLAVTVANLRREKGYDVLLAAADHVRRRHPDAPVRFLSVGQGPLEAELRARHASLGLGDRFLFLGYQSDALRWLAAADLFVLASRHEGLPVALMEALVLGVPVVATRVGGIPQAVTSGQEGELVEPDRASALGDAIADLAQDPRRRQEMAARARRRGGDFDIARAQRRYEALYSALRRR